MSKRTCALSEKGLRKVSSRHTREGNWDHENCLGVARFSLRMQTSTYFPFLTARKRLRAQAQAGRLLACNFPTPQDPGTSSSQAPSSSESGNFALLLPWFPARNALVQNRLLLCHRQRHASEPHRQQFSPYLPEPSKEQPAFKGKTFLQVLSGHRNVTGRFGLHTSRGTKARGASCQNINC